MYIGSERKECALARVFIGDNLMVELAPFSFKLPGGVIQHMATRLA